MYKSMLQILCQRNSWGLPEYSTAKCGLDHNPGFTATVTVNGVPFSTADQKRSSKEAQNQAAKVAFDHFSPPNRNPSPSPSPSPSASPNFPQPSRMVAPPSAPVPTYSPGFPAPIRDFDINPSIEGMSLPTTLETMQAPLMNGIPYGVKDDMKFIDVRHLYKNRLQNYVQKKNLPLPEYSNEREGPPHVSRFKSKVTVDGKTYGSHDFFPTLKEAEHAAAKVAWESLSANEVQEDDSGLYKNLLQEFAQKEGFNVPKYETTSSGPPHMPTFVSTLEIGGESFEGQASKSKKQAETNAAKTAYTALKERKECAASGRASLIPIVLSSGCHIKNALEASSSILQSVISGDLQQSAGPKADIVIHEEQNKECLGDFLTGDLQQRAVPKESLLIREGRDEEHIAGNEEKFSNLTTTDAAVSTHHSPPRRPDDDINSKRHKSLTLVDIIYASLRDPFPSTSSSPEDGVSLPSMHSECSNFPTLDSHNETPVLADGTNALPGEKIMVFPRVPNMTFPDGATVLPFSDDKWVAIKLKSG